MERAKEIKLLSQCLELTQGKRPFMTGPELLIPVAHYLDAARFERELALMRGAMNVVAHASQIAASGDFITRDLLGTPLILVRHRDGSAKAFINVCRHRGATVELRESGRCKRFVCPYHAWTYDTDGSLAAVRHSDGFPTLDFSTSGLVELPCAEAGGLVWVCPEPGAQAGLGDEAATLLAAELDALGSSDSSVFASESRDWNANWKLIVDGGLESYHFKIAHRGTIAAFFPDNVSTYEFIGDHIRSVLPRSSILGLAEQPQSAWDIRQHTHLLYSIAPNASVLVQEHHFELIISTPLSIDETRTEIMTVARNPGPNGFSERAKEFLSANHAFTKKTLDEDFEIAEQIQRGMKSGANEHYRFACFESALTAWHRRLNEKLGSPLDEPAG
jgi:phenylpropionate dioxygenase-like ring-hydroxylating dioxygenase large terminal subunit